MEKELQTSEAKQVASVSTSVYFNPIIWEQMTRIGATLYNSGALTSDIKNSAMLMMKLQAGYELGMQPVQSLNSLYIVGGLVTIWGEEVLRRFIKAGYKHKYLQFDEKKCIFQITCPDGTVYVEEATYEEAEKSGWTKDRSGKLKFNYKCPTDKIRYNAIRRMAKFNCSEVLGNLEVKEYAEDITQIDPETGEHIVEKKTEEKKEEKTVKKETPTDEPTFTPKKREEEVKEKTEKKAENVEIKVTGEKVGDAIEDSFLPEEKKAENVEITTDPISGEIMPAKKEEPKIAPKETRTEELEAHEAVVNLFEKKAEKDPKNWDKSTLDNYIKYGMENLFRKTKLRDLTIQELKKYKEVCDFQASK